MTTRRTVTAGILVILLGTLWIAGSATAHPPTDTLPGSGAGHLAGTTKPLLQYQGRLTDPDTGEPVADGSHTMTFRLYDSESGSSELWTETEDVSVQGGVFSTILGDKTALDQDLFDGRELWLGVKVGADAEMTPRQRILPVAYALSLLPGAVISTTSDSPALELINAGTGATLAVTNTLQDGIWASGGGGDWAAGIVGLNYSDVHGMGVQGWSKVTSGESYGVWGWTASPEGAGVRGIGQNGSHGVYGETAYDAEWYEANGVMGYSIYTNTAGVYGESEHGNGVFGKANADQRSGVVGWNLGAASGVYGVSEQGHGISGATHNVAGGYEFAGVYGRSTHTETFGVLGESDYGIGVEGRIWEPDNHYPAVQGWNTGGGPGVEGYSQNHTGVHGEGATYGGHFVSDSGKALRADGDVEINGNLVATGTVAGGDGTSLPIAYGFVNDDGSLASGSPNVTSRWSSRDDRYEITIAGYTYFYSDYVTLVTLSAPCTPAPCAAQTNSVDGKLLVHISDGNGSAKQASFQFVTYKP